MHFLFKINRLAPKPSFFPTYAMCLLKELLEIKGKKKGKKKQVSQLFNQIQLLKNNYLHNKKWLRRI